MDKPRLPLLLGLAAEVADVDVEGVGAPRVAVAPNAFPEGLPAVTIPTFNMSTSKLLNSAPSQPVTQEHWSDTDHLCTKRYALVTVDDWLQCVIAAGSAE